MACTWLCTCPRLRSRIYSMAGLAPTGCALPLSMIFWAACWQCRLSGKLAMHGDKPGPPV